MNREPHSQPSDTPADERLATDWESLDPRKRIQDDAFHQAVADVRASFRRLLQMRRRRRNAAVSLLLAGTLVGSGWLLAGRPGSMPRQIAVKNSGIGTDKEGSRDKTSLAPEIARAKQADPVCSAEPDQTAASRPADAKSTEAPSPAKLREQWERQRRQQFEWRRTQLLTTRLRQLESSSDPRRFDWMDQSLASEDVGELAWSVLIRPRLDAATLGTPIDNPWLDLAIRHAGNPQRKQAVLESLVVTRAHADRCIQLATDASWRHEWSRVAVLADDDVLRRWIDGLRNRDVVRRAAISFLLAHADDEKVNRIASAMIVRGIDRCPAYLALFSRPTPERRQWLEQVSGDKHLAPSLYSARLQWQRHASLVHRWIEATPPSLPSQTELSDEFAKFWV